MTSILNADQERRTLGEQIEQAVSRLDQRTVAALISHPCVLDTAIEVAARTIDRVESDRSASVEHFGSAAVMQRLSPAEARRRLDKRTRVTEPEGLIGATEVAQLLGLGSRQAVHGRRERGTLLGFQNGRRDMLFPREQFDARGRVLPGLTDVLVLFGDDGFAAWSWLTAPTSALDEDRPIDRLWRDELDDVLAAARDFQQGDFG